METSAGDVPEGVTWIDFASIEVPDYVGEATLDDEPRPAPEDIFPASVLELDGQRVALDGFMNPIAWVPGARRAVSAFIFSPYPAGCHFGSLPRMDQFIEANAMDEDGLPFFPFRAIRTIGTLRVGEEVDDYGYVMSIFRLEVESVEQLW